MCEDFEGVAYLVIWDLLIPVDEGLNSSHRIAFLDGEEDIPWSHVDDHLRITIEEIVLLIETESKP